MTEVADWPTRHSLKVGRRGDRGSVSLELAVLGPAVLLLTFAIVQAGLYSYARSLALAAAREGVTAGRAYGAAPSAGAARATAFLTQHAGDSLAAAVASSSGSSATVVRIEVTGRALSVLPGFAGLEIRQAAQAERERFTTEGQP